MTRRIAWINEKGGVAKSTSAFNTAAILAHRFGKRVLLIDADHQANVTTALIGDDPQRASLADVLVSGVAAADVIQPTAYERLHLLPASASLSDVNVAMADPTSPLGMGRELRLKRSLEPVEGRYDFVVIDTSPQRTLLNINVLNYAEEILVPVDPGYWSVMGIRNLEELVGLVRTHMGHERLHISGVVLTKMQRTNVARDVEAQVREHFGERVFRTAVPLNVKVEEAHSRGQSVLDYAPDSPGAVAYLSITEQILEYTENNGARLAEHPTADNASVAA